MSPRPKKPKIEEGVEEFSLYNGEVKLLYKDSSHRTVIDDGGLIVRPPSITTVLNVLNKPALVPWAAGITVDYIRTELENLFAGSSIEVNKVFAVIESAREAHTRAKQGAADIGTAAHDWLHEYWRSFVRKTDKPGLPEAGPIRNCITAVLDWISDHKVQPLLVERPLYSRKHQITGRPDFIGLVDDEPCVLDYKSTKQLWPELPLQMAPYALMYEEEFGVKAHARWGLRMDKLTGEFQDKRYPPETIDLDFDTFMAAFKIYDRLKHLRRKEKPEVDFFAELEAA